MIPALIDRCWQAVRSFRSPPSNRAYNPPECTLSNFQLTETQADELLASLPRYHDTPPITRVSAEFGIIRGVVHSGWVDRVDEALARLKQYVGTVGSPLADVLCTELHGTVARQRQQWAEAADWYRQVIAAPAYQPATQFGVLVAFHHLAIRALAGQATTLTGADLRDPWSLVNELALTIVKYHGAISTATASTGSATTISPTDSSHGSPPTRTITPSAPMPVCSPPWATRSPLPTAQNLDELLREVFALADKLDCERLGG